MQIPRLTLRTIKLHGVPHYDWDGGCSIFFVIASPSQNQIIFDSRNELGVRKVRFELIYIYK